jgi:hypothetical protein
MFTPNTQLWDFIGAKDHWNAWFSFINTNCCSKNHAIKMSMPEVRMAIIAWGGARMNWAGLLFYHLHKEVMQAKTIVAMNLAKCTIIHLFEQSVIFNFTIPIKSSLEQSESSEKGK